MINLDKRPVWQVERSVVVDSQETLRVVCLGGYLIGGDDIGRRIGRAWHGTDEALNEMRARKGI